MTLLLVRLGMTIVCGVGFYASVFMLRKGGLARRGLLRAPSIASLPTARLAFGLPNAAFGAAYYLALALSAWLGCRVWPPAPIAASLAAALMSAVLARSLVVNARECPVCWTAHIVNFLLVPATAALFLLSYC